jgi:hypothetical protein
MALPVEVSGLPRFVKDAQPLFRIRRDEDGKYRWEDGEGNGVAVEDEGDGQHRLLIGVSLCRQRVDALVALWCCRLWKVAAENSPAVDGGLDGGMVNLNSPALLDVGEVDFYLPISIVRRKLKLAKEVPTYGSAFF